MQLHRPFRFGIVTHNTNASLDALVAQATSTLRVGSFVFANDFRHPALLAKTAATLDVISGGRFELGLGAGWMQSEYEQVGLAFATPRVRIDRMVEALQVIKGLFSEDPVTFAGIHYQITNMRGHPSPVQRPR